MESISGFTVCARETADHMIMVNNANMVETALFIFISIYMFIPSAGHFDADLQAYRMPQVCLHPWKHAQLS
jgi:hypothetical protein